MDTASLKLYAIISSLRASQEHDLTRAERDCALSPSNRSSYGSVRSMSVRKPMLVRKGEGDTNFDFCSTSKSVRHWTLSKFLFHHTTSALHPSPVSFRPSTILEHQSQHTEDIICQFCAGSAHSHRLSLLSCLDTARHTSGSTKCVTGASICTAALSLHETARRAHGPSYTETFRKVSE